MTCKKSRMAFFVPLIFLAGALTSSVFEWLQPVSTIEITNVSTRDISYIDIEYRGDYKYTTRLAEKLKPHEGVVFKGISNGEASYSLEVKFDYGTIVSGGAGYHGRGDVVREYVGITGVMSSTRNFPSLFYSDPRETTHHEKGSTRADRLKSERSH